RRAAADGDGTAACAARSQCTPRRFECITTARRDVATSSVRSVQPGRAGPRASRRASAAACARATRPASSSFCAAPNVMAAQDRMAVPRRPAARLDAPRLLRAEDRLRLEPFAQAEHALQPLERLHLPFVELDLLVLGGRGALGVEQVE